ncbi:MAG: type II secretion system protein GspN [Turneriella sp.]|nr:type II secretion system protein GspN [Turneriella sp.]
MAETENTEIPPPPEPVKNWYTRLKKITPFLSGLLAFLIGLIWFAPLESYAVLALRHAAASGYHIEFSDLSLSVFGNYHIEGIKIPLGSDSEKPGQIKIAEAKGRAALFGIFLGEKYEFSAEALICSLSKGDFTLKIDSLQLKSNLEAQKSGGTEKLLSGPLELEAEAAQISYKETRFLKEDIVIPFLKIVLKAQARQNQIAIETGEAIGRLVNAQLRGTVTVGPQPELNLVLTLKPTEEFYQKYQDKDPKTLLRIANVLHDDGRIELKIRGSLAQPVVEPVPAAKTQP